MTFSSDLLGREPDSGNQNRDKSLQTRGMVPVIREQSHLSGMMEEGGDVIRQPN